MIEPVYSVTGSDFEKQQDLTWLRFGCSRGCRAGNSRVTNLVVSRTPLESGAIERESRVDESHPDSKPVPEYRGARETLRESAETIP